MSLAKLIEKVKAIEETESHDPYEGRIRQLYEAAEMLHSLAVNLKFLDVGNAGNRAAEALNQVDQICKE